MGERPPRAAYEQYSNVKTIHGRRAVVRNGYLPEREIVTAVGPVPVKVPKIRDRSGAGIKFNSSIVPPYVRKSPRVLSSLPWLYLRGVSTGAMGEALSELLGEQAKGLSASVVSRLKAAWADEYEQWRSRSHRRRCRRTTSRGVRRRTGESRFRRDSADSLIMPRHGRRWH